MALTRGRTRREVADELGNGLSSLRRWIRRGRDEESVDEADTYLRAKLKAV